MRHHQQPTQQSHQQPFIHLKQPYKQPAKITIILRIDGNTTPPFPPNTCPPPVKAHNTPPHALPPRSGGEAHPQSTHPPLEAGGGVEESSSAPRLGRPCLRGGRVSTFPSATLAPARTTGAAVAQGGGAPPAPSRAGRLPDPNPLLHGDIIRPRVGGQGCVSVRSPPVERAAAFTRALGCAQAPHIKNRRRNSIRCF